MDSIGDALTSSTAHEIRDYVSATTTAGAAVFAAVAIKQSKDQSYRNARMIADEDLDILKDLAQMQHGSFTQNAAAAQPRLRALHADDVPLTMARYALKSTPEATKRYVEASNESGPQNGWEPMDKLGKDIDAELQTAITKRLAEGHV